MPLKTKTICISALERESVSGNELIIPDISVFLNLLTCLSSEMEGLKILLNMNEPE